MQKTILLVDDEPHILRIIRLSLERENYRILTAHNGEKALDILAEGFPDILITDIDMPRMNGKELCQNVVKKYPHRTFLIIVLTSRAEREHREWSSQIRNLEFLEKPVSIRSLKLIIDKFLTAVTAENDKATDR